ncbi:coiled-coil domain-containing protein [Pseudoalteromonas piscicida]|uniref:coiled-coil domain-containing protein n=1 Tax=Pseudoalteromonas piscicida TaxID=43662 RepID=UPI0005FA8641|nr:hypothetical protein [Pseudoalteromonas piscicida]KJZ03541.1 hypothetical protein TW73_07720 [Pseudoalteromonas piscicida]
MTIESQLAQLQQAATEQTEASVQLANNITEGLQEIDQVKQDIAQTYQTVNQNNQALNDWQTQSGSVNLKDLNGNSHTLPTLKSLIADAQSVNPHPHVMTKAQFDALREMRKQQYAGSGFVEWGKHLKTSYAINEGMWERAFEVNTLRMGAGYLETGSSNSLSPKLSVDGVEHILSQVTNTDFGFNNIRFPPAPDGTKTYDSASGTVTQHNDAEAAFAAETDSNKVITSRKDLVFLESWHEKIAEKDVVYPLGNVQYGANSYKGITLRNNLVAQGYSAFGEWDADTKGHGVKWSSLTEPQKATFLGEPEHNIYYDPKAKAYIQVRYRVRVVEGVGDNWYRVQADGVTVINQFLGYSSGNQTSVVKPQGASTELLDLGAHPAGNRGMYKTPFTVLSNSEAGLGAFVACQYDGSPVSGISSNSKCYALPIALVQRLNQGAYHPVYNPFGCNMFTQINVRNYYWYSLPQSFAVNALACFTPATTTSIGTHPTFGRISGGDTGRPDQYKYHDAIYAGQVKDLRLNANKVDVNLLRENVMRQAVAGTFRGKGKLLFTRFKALHKGYFGGSNIHNAIFKDAASNGVSLNFYDNDFPMYTPVMVWQPSTSTTLYGRISTSNSHIMLTNHPSNLGKGRHIDPDVLGLNRADICYFAEVNTLSPEFDSLPWVDIIGSPENIAATFPDGVVGQWMPKLPTGVIERFAANRKATGGQYGIFTLDNGASWRTTISTFNSVSNDFTNDCEANRVQLMYYESSSKFTEQVQNSHILGLLDKSYFSADYALSRGNRLMGSLIDKAGKSDQNSKRYGYVANESLAINNDELLISNGYSPTHKNLSIGSPRNNSAAFKVMPSITSKNGLLYLQFHGVELKHNGTDWGDDQTIPIIDGENTKTDLNGNTVKVFCHHTLFPIGVAHNG